MKELEHSAQAASSAIRALVLCGGQGTRIRSVLADRPKSMALISGTPFLQVLIKQLKTQGIDNVILGTGYMAEAIESYFGSGENFAMHIDYSRETKPLGTGGAIKLAESFVNDPVLVLNGDSYADWTLLPLVELLTSKNAAMVVVLQMVSDVSRFGNVVIDQNGRIVRFVEKGTSSGAGLINAGVYLLRKKIVSDLPAGIAISFEREVLPSILHLEVYGLVVHGLFIDIGVPDDLRRAQTLMASHAHHAASAAIGPVSPKE